MTNPAITKPQQNSPHPLAQLRKDVKSVLPTLGIKDTDQERMQSVLMIAVERDPDLVNADRQSLISALRQCANHGLVPDGNEATLQVYNTKVKIDGRYQWIKKVQYQPMIRGIVNRVLKSGKVKAFWAEVVYNGEDFKIDASDGERRPIHNKASEFQRGTDKDVVGAYSVAKFKDGTVDCEPMSLEEINKVRKVAKTQKVWDGWFSEKAKVAVMRRHSKRLPLSAEDLDMILNRQETDFDQPIRDVTPSQEEYVPLSKRLAKAQTEAEQDETPDPIEGEVMDGHWTDDIDTSDATPMDELFDEGAKAFKAGTPRTDCPHSDPVMAGQWLGGWDQTKQVTENG